MSQGGPDNIEALSGWLAIRGNGGDMFSVKHAVADGGTAGEIGHVESVLFQDS